MKNYQLEIYPPNGTLEPLTSIQSNTPFGAISKGDLLNPRLLVGKNMASFEIDGLLEVVKLEHMIWENETETRHKICVFTKLVEDSEKSRI